MLWSGLVLLCFMFLLPVVGVRFLSRIEQSGAREDRQEGDRHHASLAS